MQNDKESSKCENQPNEAGITFETLQNCINEILKAPVKIKEHTIQINGKEEKKLLLRSLPENANGGHWLAKVLFEKAVNGDMVAFKEILKLLDDGEENEEVPDDEFVKWEKLLKDFRGEGKV